MVYAMAAPGLVDIVSKEDRHYLQELWSEQAAAEAAALICDAVKQREKMLMHEGGSYGALMMQGLTK
jgi:hypothetical protein